MYLRTITIHIARIHTSYAHMSMFLQPTAYTYYPVDPHICTYVHTTYMILLREPQFSQHACVVKESAGALIFYSVKLLLLSLCITQFRDFFQQYVLSSNQGSCISNIGMCQGNVSALISKNLTTTQYKTSLPKNEDFKSSFSMFLWLRRRCQL